MIPHAIEHLGAVLVLEQEDTNNVVQCCSEKKQLIELSDGFVTEFSWDKLSSIPLYVQTRKDIRDHKCRSRTEENMSDRYRRMKCNGCTAHLDTREAENIDDVFKELRDNEWTSTKGKVWCPKCKGEKKDA